MNITQSKKGDNLISIKINVEKADYEEMVEKTLRQMRHKANVIAIIAKSITFSVFFIVLCYLCFFLCGKIIR